MFRTKFFVSLLPLLARGVGGIDEDLAGCCPAPLSPCAVQHPCCIKLCQSLPGLAVRLGGGQDAGCCPTWDPCGEQGVPCRLCNCPSEQQEEMEGIDVIMGEQRRNETEEGDGDEILAEEGGTGKNIAGEETNTTAGAGKGVFARMNLDFLFSGRDEVTTEADDQIEEAKEEGIDDGSTCCPAPSNPCEVRHPCCFRLCSSISLAVRGLSGDALFSGCCPSDDPCGENEESGNCIQCSSLCQEEEDWLVQGRFGGEAGGWEDAEEGEGLTRDSGRPVENSQVWRARSKRGASLL